MITDSKHAAWNLFIVAMHKIKPFCNIFPKGMRNINFDRGDSCGEG